MVERSLVAQQPEGDEWFEQIGSAEEGVQAGNRIVGCPKPLPHSINPVRQLQLTMLAVGAFLEMYFADTELERRAAARYLVSEISFENPDISITAGAVPVTMPEPVASAP